MNEGEKIDVAVRLQIAAMGKQVEETSRVACTKLGYKQNLSICSVIMRISHSWRLDRASQGVLPVFLIKMLSEDEKYSR